MSNMILNVSEHISRCETTEKKERDKRNKILFQHTE